MILVNPIEDPELFDCVIIDGVKSPGISKFSSGWGREWKVTGNPVLAQDSFVTHMQGKVPAEGQVTVSIWKPEHFQEWFNFQWMLQKKQQTRKVSACVIVHPDLVQLQILNVIVKKIGIRVPDGMMSNYTIDFMEYRKPKPAGGAPAFAKDPVAKPQNAREEQIAALMNKIQQHDNIYGPVKQK